jgi:Cof subfamily protein (haloacid dehalogenase superfamily)
MDTLYISDLDGTLLNNNGKLSAYSIETINEIINNGICFSFATARSLTSASRVTNGLITNLPVITKNGIFIENVCSKERLHSLSFSDEEKLFLREALEKYSIYPLVHGYVNGVEKKSWLVNKESEAIKNEINSWKKEPRLRPVDTPDDLYCGELFHINCMGNKNDLKDIYNYLLGSNKFNCLLQKEYYSEYYWCEILPKNATKGNTTLVLKDLLKCDKIISFGDEINDIAMFKISNECYAVENGKEELKKYATGIIESNENNGVAKWLKENYKIRGYCT